MTEAQLVEQAIGLPRREASRWRHFARIDQEDLVADGNVGLVRAARRYDPRSGVPFPVFARKFVRGAILDTIGRHVRRARLDEGTYADVRGFDDLTGLDGRSFEVPDPGPSTEERAEQLDRLRLLASLTQAEQHALIRTKVDGADVDTVGRELGVSAHRVYALVDEGARRLRRRAA